MVLAVFWAAVNHALLTIRLAHVVVSPPGLPVASPHLSPAQLCNMKEAELRTEVLIPLFKRMGFKDVQHYHPGEQGKDIVMWLPTSLDDREYYAVDHPLCERNS